MFHARFPIAHHFTASLFGCQYHGPSPDEPKLSLIRKFDGLLRDGAIHVEAFEQNDLPSQVWMSHWKSPQDFKAWWESSDVVSFWAALPDDAGFWRETVSLPATRSMYMANKETPHGFGNCGELTP
ncbi:Phenylacetaldoxime dehydratase [Apiospora saccharicola]